MNPDLLISVPDLQAARIAAAAGIAYICLDQKNPHLLEIKSWLEGVKTGVFVEDPDLPIPMVDFILIPEDSLPTYQWLEKEILILDAVGNLARQADQQILRYDTYPEWSASLLE
jgi:hypothetical protein